MLKIYLVRHGETEATRQLRYQGKGDSGLTEQGLCQARQVASVLRGEPVSHVFSSDMRRAVETAKVIAQEHGLTPIQLPSLREVDFGEWEGLTFQEISHKYPDLVDKWLRDPVNTRPPGGETLLEMSQRVLTCLDRIAESCVEGVVVVVSHGGPARAVLSSYQEGDLGGFWSIPQPPGVVNVIHFEDHCFRVKAFNIDPARLRGNGIP
ncbi:MAG: alpha-ribazole phosphatase [Bacillota bacterium]